MLYRICEAAPRSHFWINVFAQVDYLLNFEYIIVFPNALSEEVPFPEAHVLAIRTIECKVADADVVFLHVDTAAEACQQAVLDCTLLELEDPVVMLRRYVLAVRQQWRVRPRLRIVRHIVPYGPCVPVKLLSEFHEAEKGGTAIRYYLAGLSLQLSQLIHLFLIVNMGAQDPHIDKGRHFQFWKLFDF